MDTTYRNTPSALAALEPLPEVSESDTESAWMMFLELQRNQNFAPTEPSGPVSLSLPLPRSGSIVTVNDVMVEARCRNRAAPREEDWHLLHDLLKASTGREPPRPMSATELQRSSPLVMRSRVRDQVEWAEQHRQLELVLRFFKTLPEDRWVHIGR